jgi:hypothetical protein
MCLSKHLSLVPGEADLLPFDLVALREEVRKQNIVNVH